jgi:hypothetical protein
VTSNGLGFSWNPSCIYAMSGVMSGIFGGFAVTPVEQIKISLASRSEQSMILSKDTR